MILRTTRFALALYLAISATFLFGEVRKALVIGVSDYPNYTENPIKFAHIDALRFERFLESDRAGRVEVKALTNEDATRDAIWDAVEALRSEQPRPDTLFVFFSGHAELDSDTDQLYLMPTGGDRKRLSATGLLASEFITKLKAVGPTNLLIFLDACHTGAAILAKGGPNATDSVRGSLDPLIAKLNKGNEGGVMVFVSATKDELSWEDEEYSQGLYTRLLIRGLEGEAAGVDGQKDGTVTAGELQSFLTREVPNRARALGKPPQHPVVSPDFKSAYVIALASAPQNSPRAMPAVKMRDVERLRSADPELALMLHTGVLQLTSTGSKWEADSNAIVGSYELARVRKIGVIPTSVRPESLISPIISDDGSLLVACSEPSSVVSVSLKSDGMVTRVPLQSASFRASSHTILDSCDISVSRDRRYAIVRLHTIDGGSQLWLAGLRGGTPPPFTVTDYESGVFLENSLVLSKAVTLTVVAVDSWATLFTGSLAKPAHTLIADPASGYFASLRDDGASIYKFDNNQTQPVVVRELNGYRALKDCYLTGQRLFCVNGAGFWFQGTSPADSGSGGYGCNSGSPRGLPSSSTPAGLGWDLLFGCPTEPETLHFIRGVAQGSQVSMSESVLAARLLANGNVTVVGQRGGIYFFDSIKYGECCTVQSIKPNTRTRVAAGNNGFTAVFQWDSSVGNLAVLRGRDLLIARTWDDAKWVQQIAWSETNRTIVLAGESRVRLLELAGSDYKSVHEIEVDCGMPAAVDKSDHTFVCVDPETREIQLRSVATGKVVRTFNQHVGPIHQLYLDGTTVTAAGTFKGRGQTLITVWNSSNGKVVSQRSCPVGGTQPEKPFSFLQRGKYFTQLDTPSRVLTRESLTCESGIPFVIDTSSAMLRGASAGDNVVVSWNDMFRAFNPWAEGSPSPAWNLELNVEDLAMSPDGADVVAIVGGRILRIPVTKTGFLDLVKQRIPREFSSKECEEFFAGESCPHIKQ